MMPAKPKFCNGIWNAVQKLKRQNLLFWYFIFWYFGQYWNISKFLVLPHHSESLLLPLHQDLHGKKSFELGNDLASIFATFRTDNMQLKYLLHFIQTICKYDIWNIYSFHPENIYNWIISSRQYATEILQFTLSWVPWKIRVEIKLVMDLETNAHSQHHKIVPS